jgi:hypothetical protein
MSEESPETPRSEEPDVEGHLAALGPEKASKAAGPAEALAARSGEAGEPEGSDVEGHVMMFRAAEPVRKRG